MLLFQDLKKRVVRMRAYSEPQDKVVLLVLDRFSASLERPFKRSLKQVLSETFQNLRQAGRQTKRQTCRQTGRQASR
jgi:hypothetical protein